MIAVIAIFAAIALGCIAASSWQPRKLDAAQRDAALEQTVLATVAFAQTLAVSPKPTIEDAAIVPQPPSDEVLILVSFRGQYEMAKPLQTFRVATRLNLAKGQVLGCEVIDHLGNPVGKP
jgi:hypothetical protein